jgi:hypothetical protein
MRWGALLLLLLLPLLLLSSSNLVMVDTAEQLGRTLVNCCAGPVDFGKKLWAMAVAACGSQEELNAVALSFQASGQVQGVTIESLQPALSAADRRDVEARRLVCENVRRVFAVDLRASGTRTIPEQQRADTISAALYSEKLEGCGFESIERVVGVNKTQLKRGAKLNEENKKRSRTSQGLMIPRSVRVDKRPLEWIYRWFHDKSPDVELNKNDKSQWKKKTVVCAGRERTLTCVKRVLTTTKQQAARNFKESPEWKDYIGKNPGMTLDDANVAACICPCIQEEQREECACPLCTSMMLKLKAWRQQRPSWHEDGSCKCKLDCKNPESAWRRASAGFAGLESAVLCEQSSVPGLELPHLSAEAPAFYDLGCCLLPLFHRNDEFKGWYPASVNKCKDCGWRDKFGDDTCDEEYNDQPASWDELGEVKAGDGSTRRRFRKVGDL